MDKDRALKFRINLGRIHPALNREDLGLLAKQILPNDNKDLKNAIKNINNNVDRDELSKFLRLSPSPVLIFKYLLAPKYPQENVDHREKILSDFQKVKLLSSDPKLVSKFKISTTALSALCVIPFGLSFFGEQVSNNMVQDFSQALQIVSGSVLASSGLALATNPKQIIPIIKNIKDIFLTIASNSNNLSKYQIDVPLIDSFYKKDSAIQLDKIFGYDNNKEDLFDAYNQINRSDRHLIAHLNGVELRAFLLGDDNLRRDILIFNPPSFDARLSCVLSKYPESADIFKNFRQFYNQYLEPVVLDWSSEVEDINSTTLKSSLKRMRDRKTNSNNTISHPKPN